MILIGAVHLKACRTTLNAQHRSEILKSIEHVESVKPYNTGFYTVLYTGSYEFVHNFGKPVDMGEIKWVLEHEN